MMQCIIFLLISLSVLGTSSAQKDCMAINRRLVKHGHYFVYKRCTRVAKCVDGYFNDARSYSCPENSHCFVGTCVCDSRLSKFHVEKGITKSCGKECERDGLSIGHGSDLISDDCSSVETCNNGNFTHSKSFSCPKGSVCDGCGICTGGGVCCNRRHCYGNGETFIFGYCRAAVTCIDGDLRNRRAYSCPPGKECDGGKLESKCI